MPPTTTPHRSEAARWWPHQPGLTFLNHGSFGGCPAAVLETQAAWRARLEADPVRFFVQDLFELTDWARAWTARFLGCDPAGLVFVPNATTGVATALFALDLGPGDEVLRTDHEYPACVNNLDAIAARAGATVVVAQLPMPDPTPQAVADAILSRVTPRTRAALFSHITSASAMVLPAFEIAAELEARGVAVVLDGAHAPGHVPLDLSRCPASFYAANLHKWVCSPKGSAVLFAREDRRVALRPLVLSNMARDPMPARPHLHTEFDYVGTGDPTAVLCVPASLEIMADIALGAPPRRRPPHTRPIDGAVANRLATAWSVVRSCNRRLALGGLRTVAGALGTPPPVPESMTACIALVALPRHDPELQRRLDERPSRYNDALQDALVDRHQIQAPIVRAPSPAGPIRCVRLSAQLYNAPAQYEHLAAALAEELARERG